MCKSHCSWGVAATALTMVALAVAADDGRVPAPRGPQPRKITLQATNEPLDQVLSAFAKEARIPVSNRLGSNPQVSIDLREETFWKALDAIGAAAGARVDLYGKSGLALVKGKPATLPVSHDGLFRCTLRKLSATRDFESGTHGTTAQVEVAWQPGLEPLLLETHAQDVTILDAAGKATRVPPDGSSLGSVDGRVAQTIEVSLPAFPRSVTRIGEFSGKLTVVAPTKMVVLDFGSLFAMATGD